LRLDSQNSVKAIRYKDKLRPAILKYISYVNKNLTNPKVSDPYMRNLKLVIAGGEAFNHYIKRAKKTSVIETHDYDLRLYLDMQPSSSPLFNENRESTEKWMLEISTAIGDGFSDFLNMYTSQIGRPQNISQFKTVYRGFLTTVEYDIDGEHDSLVDIVPHIPSKVLFYGALDVNKEKLFEAYQTKDFGGVTSRQGFFKSSLVYVRDSYGIYYVSLGYLVWDTVRMLNYLIDSGRFEKFERYLTKYKILLTALSRPELYLRCDAADKFIENCRDTIKVCKIDGTSFETKEELIRKGIEDGILPEGKDWYTAFSKMDFSDICKAIIS
jgi:hypothetical protein